MLTQIVSLSVITGFWGSRRSAEVERAQTAAEAQRSFSTTYSWRKIIFLIIHSSTLKENVLKVFPMSHSQEDCKSKTKGSRPTTVCFLWGRRSSNSEVILEEPFVFGGWTTGAWPYASAEPSWQLWMLYRTQEFSVAAQRESSR